MHTHLSVVIVQFEFKRQSYILEAITNYSWVNKVIKSALTSNYLSINLIPFEILKLTLLMLKSAIDVKEQVFDKFLKNLTPMWYELYSQIINVKIESRTGTDTLIQWTIENV